MPMANVGRIIKGSKLVNAGHGIYVYDMQENHMAPAPSSTR